MLMVGPSGRGREMRVGIVVWGRREDGSWRAYARRRRAAGKLDARGIEARTVRSQGEEEEEEEEGRIWKI